MNFPLLAALLGILAGLCPPLTVRAGEARHAPPLSEIVVSARKREESLARVPASVHVSGRERLEAGNLNRLDELAEFVPGLAASETGIGHQLYIRGIGSGNNPAFEQSVGQYLDGIHYGRAPLTALPFLDIERVEVLRGPQSILFGKNAVAGALNLVSARPTDQAEIRLRSLYEFSARQAEHEALLSGPLGRGWKGRLAWRGLREAGYVDNSLRRRREPARRENALRLSLARDFSPRLDSLLKLEAGRYRSRGKALEIVRDEPNLLPAGTSPLAGLNLAETFAALGLASMDSRHDYRRQADAGGTDLRLGSATLNTVYRFERSRLSLVTGLLDYRHAQRCDCDFSPVPLLDGRQNEAYRQFSQELRLESDSAAGPEWVLGAYFQGAELAISETLAVPPEAPFDRLAAVPSAGTALGLLPGTAARRANRQSSRAGALFFQAGWPLTGDLRLSLGGRYTVEAKRATRVLDLLDAGQRLVPEGDALAKLYRDALGIHSRQLPGSGHSVRGQRDEAQFTPLVRLEGELANASLYAGVVRGYKGGGFDARANDPAAFEFREEKATALEAGLKSRWLDAALEVNAALFATRYRNLQISQFDGGVGFNVGNARRARAWGLELEGRWALTPRLRLDYAWAWLDFAFQDFRNGNCPNRRPPDGEVVGGVGLCDFSGLPGKYAPRQRLSLALDYRHPLDGATLLLSGSLNYRGAQHIHDNLDPALRVPSALRANLLLGLESPRWRLALVGRNLSRARILSHAGNLPLAAALFGTNTFYAQLGRPRQIALEAAWRFR